MKICICVANLRNENVESGEFVMFNGDTFLPQELIIGGLKPETLYSVSVAAYTTKGDGAHSRPKLVHTLGIGEHTPSIELDVGDLVTYSRIDLPESCTTEQH